MTAPRAYCEFKIEEIDGTYRHSCYNCPRVVTTTKLKVVAMCKNTAANPVPADILPQCKYLGAQDGEAPCLPCRGSKQLPVHSCQLFGRCTPTGVSAAIKSCEGCPAYEARTTSDLGIVVLGYPAVMGGAGTELWHTLQMWRKAGWPVTLIPTWSASQEWRDKTASIGVKTINANPSTLMDVPGLPGSVIVSFCNDQFLEHASTLRRIGCKLVFANCMTWLFNKELEHYAKFGTFHAYMFQSDFQLKMLGNQLLDKGAVPSQFHLIPGAFDVDEFPFVAKPRTFDQPFYIGRISRPDLDKWHKDTWKIYGAVDHPMRKARMMAWTEKLTEKCGAPPTWAEVLPGSAESAQKFVSSLHCLLPVNDSARENWPRAGLEAMALGTPIVTNNAWGWRDMVKDGVTGMLCDNHAAMSAAATRLAHDDDFRMKLAAAGRKSLVEDLADPNKIIPKWRWLFESLELKLPV